MQKYMYIFALLIFAAIGFSACTDTTDLEKQIAELQQAQADMQDELSNTVDTDALTKAIQDALKGDGDNSNALKELQAQIKAIAESLPEDTDLAEAISTLETQLASKLTADDKTELLNQLTNIIQALGYDGIHENHFYVDLGLESGLLWATCNIGATNPEDFGNYYAWGELEGCDKDGKPTDANKPKTEFSWETYSYDDSEDNDGSLFSKYIGDNEENEDADEDDEDAEEEVVEMERDGLKVLEADDDIATQLWKGNWRMPSHADFEELEAACTPQWTMKNGIAGYIFTSKKNGHSIFLPAAGYRHKSDPYEQGIKGFYWSSSLDNSDVSSAYNLYFYSERENTSTSIERYFGNSVRPVYSPKKTE